MLMCNGQSIVVVAGGVKRDFARKCANAAHVCGGDEAVCYRLRPESCGFRRGLPCGDRFRCGRAGWDSRVVLGRAGHWPRRVGDGGEVLLRTRLARSDGREEKRRRSPG